MHMNTTIGLRRIKTPVAPSVKRNADRASKYGNRFGFSIREAPSLARSPGQVDGADGRDQQQHRGDLEWQQVIGEKLPGNRLHVTGVVNRVLRKAEGVVWVVRAAHRDAMKSVGVVRDPVASRDEH